MRRMHWWKRRNTYTLAQVLAEQSAGDEYRVAILSYLGVVGVYRAYLDGKVNAGRLGEAKQTLAKAKDIGTTRGKWLDYSIFVLAAW